MLLVIWLSEQLKMLTRYREWVFWWYRNKDCQKYIAWDELRDQQMLLVRIVDECA